MQIGFPSEEWIPSLINFYDRFGGDNLTKFLEMLETKFVGNWILSFISTERIENMTRILQATFAVSSIYIIAKML
jgi:hypothetical protein